MTHRLYFDKRRLDHDGRGTLRFMISKNGQTAMLSLDIKLLPDQWDGSNVVNHPDARLLNSLLSIKKGAIERAIIEMNALGKFAGKTAKEMVNLLVEEMDPDKSEVRKAIARKKELSINGLSARFSMFINLKSNQGTKQLYIDTYNKLKLFCQDLQVEFESISLNEINSTWLRSFEQFCLRTESQNTASRHLRDIRAVFNAAIDDGVTTNYPFRKFKFHYEQTKDKSFTAEEIRAFINYHSPVPGEQEAIDIFTLMLCLIGINSVDLAYCKPAERGRITYIRRKTGKLYNIKVEPEALKIIEKYKGKDYLINLLERSPNHKTIFRRMDKNLKKVGMNPVPGKRSEGKPLLSGISSGSARTSWATIAEEDLDIPREVIAAALGHHTVDVTSTYLRTEWRKKVDEANRTVLDWVFYGKKPRK